VALMHARPKAAGKKKQFDNFD